MATVKKRITVSFDDEVYDVISRLSVLTQTPKSRIVEDLFSEVSPQLASICDSLDVVHSANESLRSDMKVAVQTAQDDMRPVVDTVLNQFDIFTGKLSDLATFAASPDSDKPPSCNTGVTSSVKRLKPNPPKGKKGGKNV